MDNNTPINNTEDSKRFISLLMPAQNRIYAYVAYHVPNKNDSDDVFQEVVSTLLNKFGDYKEGTDFLKWSITVAKYKILSFHRDNKRMRIVFDECDMDQIHREALSKIESLEEESKALKSCLKKLSDKQKSLMNFRYTHEMTYRQIAKQFNISMQSAYRAISRVHASLLKCIQMTLKGGGVYEKL